jgi:hypothetical protein
MLMRPVFQILARAQYIQEMPRKELCAKCASTVVLQFLHHHRHVCRSDLTIILELSQKLKYHYYPDILSRRIFVRSDLMDSASVALGASCASRVVTISISLTYYSLE